MHKYEIIIYWSNDDHVFIAEVPELPSCVAQGSTHEAALANANEAIQLWIDTAGEFGPAVPDPREHKYPLRGPPIKYVDPTEPVWPSDVS
jgi:predicted RNase H-like HicB family nuclease